MLAVGRRPRPGDPDGVATSIVSRVPRAAKAVVGAKPEPEQQTEHGIKVREVTDYQVAWTERERGAPGAVTIQLILDRGVDEYVIRPTAEDAQLVVALMTTSGRVHFDMDRKVLMFGTTSIGS